ncbi:universal stress protein [Halorubrum sp. CBA1125]|jgi:nucleotide-binding universal stress UspA family protein|uniref:universal stress protein n=1 Tax=Halorubrum sp. CBA1125 TaxID=2668072 RepID=UPI0012E896D3|nr:universal stress protein [Halorubrum sp. CBA1125]MUW14160.1 universal stress protein [Halorubrum sp. CBA1125]
MVRQLLVPVDGSQKSLEGLEYAVTTYSDDEITVLSVMTPHDARNDGDQPFSQTDFENWYDKAQEETDDILAEARELASDHGAEITTEVDVGEPWRAIIEYAEENDIDHIIMGSHGRDDDSPLPLGSVAETVMRRSPVLVSIVR